MRAALQFRQEMKHLIPSICPGGRKLKVGINCRAGYDGVALNHMVVGRCMTSDDVCKIQAVHLKAALAAVAGVAGAARSLQVPSDLAEFLTYVLPRLLVLSRRWRLLLRLDQM